MSLIKAKGETMQISRRALLAGLTTVPLAGCASIYEGPEVGASMDEGGFGNPTMHNTMIQNGEIPYVIDLAERFASEVPTTVNFAFNSTALDGQARANLLKQADWMGQFPEARFRVFGHTDLVGSTSSNHRLGMRRARVVVNYLVAHGVARSRLEAVISQGETQPLLQTTERERQNRRTVTEVSGFWHAHPRVVNGEYALVLQRQFITGGG
jgi:outer membrane protein OmpA-like peptidoglycan-associated protein